MTQIVVTLEDDSNISIIHDAIKLIRGVKDTMVKRFGQEKMNEETVESRLKIFDKLSGSVSLSMIDLNDDRTKYLISK